MLRRVIRRLTPRGAAGPDAAPEPATNPLALIPPDLPLPYSWVLTGRLALGPMPAGPLHWQQLEDLGLRSRFSCCYPEEDRFARCPDHWRSERVQLPDHRNQEPLQLERLAEALAAAEQLLQQAAPLYLHCRAGIERSPLIAIGLTARDRGLDLFDALDWVRRCHPAARPLPEQLELLEQLLPR